MYQVRCGLKKSWKMCNKIKTYTLYRRKYVKEINYVLLELFKNVFDGPWGSNSCLTEELRENVFIHMSQQRKRLKLVCQTKEHVNMTDGQQSEATL